jgi:hypothetical protein
VAGIARSRHAEALSSVTLVSAGLERDRTAPATASRERQIAALNQHYWVQASLDGQETDLDPSFSAAVPGQRFAEPSGTTFAADDLPDDLYQRLAIRVSADVLEDGAVTHRDVLTESARAADLLDKAIRLAVEPQALARAQNVYTVTIRMGDEPSRTVPLELRKAPAGGSAAAGLLGGLGGDEPAEPTRQNPAGAVLGRLVVDFVTTGPGLRPSRSRRVIVDRLEGEPASPRLVAGMEDDDSVRLLLAQIWDGAIGVGAIQPQQLVANHLQRLTSEQAEREQALADLYLGRRMSADAGGTPSVPAEVLGLFFYGGLTRHVLAVQGGALRVFQLRPRLAFHRRGAVVGDWSQPAGVGRMQESIDLINMPFDVVGDDRSDLKVKIGIADTALERSFARHSGDFNTVPLTAAAGEQKIAFATLTSTGAVDRLSVPPAIGNVMRDALEGGSTLIAPTALVRLNGIHTFGWWSLDPESGVPLGQMELGAGQAVSETAALNKAVLTGAHTFSKFYGGMLGCFYVEAADQLVPPDGPYHVTPTFNWSQGHIIPGLPTVASGQGLAACLVDRVCEAVVEYAVLAAESGAWMADLHDLQHLLVELLGLVGPTAVSNWIGACEGGEH